MSFCELFNFILQKTFQQKGRDIQYKERHVEP